MRIVVLGAGVVGVTTAYYLAQRGHAVTVIESGDSVAGGTSFGNAGQLSYSFTDALARPEFLRKLPSLMLGRDRGIVFRPRPNLDLLRWGGRFLQQCTVAQARANTVAVLQIAMRSAALMEELMNEVPLDFAFARAGKLVLLTRKEELIAAEKSVALKQEHGCVTEILSPEGALSIEPALAVINGDFVGAIYSGNDHVADSRSFSVGLAEWLLRNRDVAFHFGEHATALVTERNRVLAVVTDRQEHAADAIVVCLGTGSATLLRPLKIDPGICPVRGYSLTLPLGERPPAASISMLQHRIVLSRIGRQLRIAGFADFVDFGTSRDRDRSDELLGLARRIAPLAADYDAKDTGSWGGFRPMTPDGRPRVGRTPVAGLMLNTGHGMLGWTLACATGDAVARML